MHRSVSPVLILVLVLLAPQAAAPRSIDDSRDLEPYVDGVMRSEMGTNSVAGATIAIVKGGEVVLSKGYGYADVATQTPVDPETTMFRIGSITKTFTWLSVMQQVERGRLQLDANVNTYLNDFQVPNTYPEDITLSHLMTHTAGFEDKIIGLFARSADRLLPISQVLGNELPARVRPPGRFTAYSNHGAALAGHIVATVSATVWEDYVEQQILHPLQMKNTTPRQPIPVPLAAGMSTGYAFRGGSLVEQPFQFVPTAPAGVMSSSAGDMARYMNMLLRHGAHETGRLVTEESGRKMMSTLFSPAPRVAGNAHGFAERRFNGMRFIGHGGSTMVFHSYFVVNHEEDLGIFVANNSSDPDLALNVIRAILDRYYPRPQLGVVIPGPKAPEAAVRVAGAYSTLRHEYTGAGKISSSMPMSIVQVTAQPDGAILVLTPETATPTRYVETEPLVYREENGPEIIAFRAGEDGRSTHAFLGNSPHFAFERQSHYQSATFSAQLLGAVLLVFVASLLAWPTRAGLRMINGSVPGSHCRNAAALRVFAWSVCGLHIVFLLRLGSALSDPLEIVFGMPEPAQRAFAMTIPLALASGALVPLTALAFKKRYWNLAGRLHYAVITLAAGSLVAWEHYWNFLGCRF